MQVTRQGKQVRLTVTSQIPYETGERDFLFYWECNSEIYAGLLARNLDDSIGEYFRKARENAYNQGWKDAKAKRRKRDWFSIYFKGVV